MEDKRKFRRDFVSINKEHRFNCGEVATIVKEERPNVTIKINEKSYILPYRDFIVVTKTLDSFEQT